MSHLKKLVQLEKAAEAFGFKWETAAQIMAQIQSEQAEINEHLNDHLNSVSHSTLQEEIGDLMHAVFSLCVFCQFDPDVTLELSIAKFERRFEAVKAIAKENGLSTLQGKSFDELMMFWDKAKGVVG